MSDSGFSDRFSHLALEWTPIQLLKRTDVKVDVFKHSLSATDGLPPYAQARIIDHISNQLMKARHRPCLWVSVDAPGTWYLHELQRLVKRKMPIVILPAGQSPKDHWDFNPHGCPIHAGNAAVPETEPPFDLSELGFQPSLVRVLRILARLATAHKPEIASLAGFSETHTRNLLQQLQAKKLVEHRKIGKYEGWAIRKTGLNLAHRSWNIPKGTHFKKHRGEFRYAGERHRRVSRIWRAWLETAYRDIDVWECWTEVPVQYGIPDALAWGTQNGREILFWLEVDSGHSSTNTMEANYKRRLQLAYDHAQEWQVPLVFCIMGPPWVVERFRWCISEVNPWVAVIGHNWHDFGRLPIFGFGDWHEDLSSSRQHLSSHSPKELPFDPTQYPPKLKKVKSRKLPVPRSSKSRFSTGEENADTWYGRHSEGEE